MGQTKPFITSRTIHTKATVLLLFLAIFDAVFTDFGIRYHYIEEVNPLMRFVYETSISGFYVLKILLPVLLLYFILKIHIKPYFTLLLISTNLLYVFVFCMHLFWITTVNSIMI